MSAFILPFTDCLLLIAPMRFLSRFMIVIAVAVFAGASFPACSATDISGFHALATPRLAEDAQNNPLAAYALGMRLLDGKPADYEQASRWFQKAAYQGQLDAALELARLLEQGRGIEKDLGGALFWYDKAAGGGLVEAMHALGRIFSGSDESYVDFDAALDWHRKAAEKNCIPSLLALATFRQMERGALITDKEAIARLERAANLGSGEAMYRLAELYLSIRGGATQGYYGPSFEVQRAVFWLEAAAIRNYAPALHQLALFRLRGVDARLDVFSAIIALEQAADQGYAPSLTLLGSLYAAGEAVPEDPIRAFVLLSLAAEQKDPIAQSALARLSGAMSPAQQNLAKRRFREWKALR